MKAQLLKLKSLKSLALISTIVAATIPQIADADIMANDGRKQVQPSTDPRLRQIGMVVERATGKVLGTSWLSGECQATTNRHVAFFKGQLPNGFTATHYPKKGFAVDIYLDLKDGEVPAKISNGVKVVNPGAFKKQVIGSYDQPKQLGKWAQDDTRAKWEDFVHLKLSECVGRELGHFELASNEAFFDRNYMPMPTDDLRVTAFQGDRNTLQSGITVEIGCKARDNLKILGGIGDEGGIYSDCSWTGGASGAPVEVRLPNGKWVVAGMVVESFETKGQEYTMVNCRKNSLTGNKNPELCNGNAFISVGVFGKSLLENRADSTPVQMARTPQSEPAVQVAVELTKPQVSR